MNFHYNLIHLLSNYFDYNFALKKKTEISIKKKINLISYRFVIIPNKMSWRRQFVRWREDNERSLVRSFVFFLFFPRLLCSEENSTGNTRAHTFGEKEENEILKQKGKRTDALNMCEKNEKLDVAAEWKKTGYSCEQKTSAAQIIEFNWWTCSLDIFTSEKKS